MWSRPASFSPTTPAIFKQIPYLPGCSPPTRPSMAFARTMAGYRVMLTCSPSSQVVLDQADQGLSGVHSGAAASASNAGTSGVAWGFSPTALTARLKR